VLYIENISFQFNVYVVLSQINKTTDMNTNTQNTSNTSRKALIVIFVLFLLSSVGMFGQTTEVVVPQSATPVVEVLNTTNQIIASDSNADFMNWFMSSKQVQSDKEGSQVSGTSTNVTRKKQIISSGVVPNKVLYRTLVKKLMSQESAIA
jgi:hypothetical protein